MVLSVKDARNTDMLTGKHGVTLTQIPFTGSSIVSANYIIVFVAVFVLNWVLVLKSLEKNCLEFQIFYLIEFTDTGITVLHSSAFETVFVLLADCIESVNWCTATHVGHRSVAENQAVASVSPVLSFIEVSVVVLHHVSQLEVSSLVIYTSIITSFDD